MDRNLLSFCSFCQNKTDEELRELDCHIDHSISRYDRNKHIAHQGEPITELYMLIEGSARTEVVSESGLKLPLEVLTAPCPLASPHLFADDNSFPYDIIALEPCRVARISRETVEDQMTACRGFLRGFLAFNAQQIRTLSHRVNVFAHKGIKAKVAFHILTIAQQGDFRFASSITQLAKYFGVERPSLSRILSEMKRDKLIDYRNRNGRILNAEALRKLVM